MSWHKMTLKVIDVLALLGLRCLGTYQLTSNKHSGIIMVYLIFINCLQNSDDKLKTVNQ